MENIIEVKDLCFSYDDNCFIKNMSFSIKRNSYTCIIGPNGSGKTTLSKLLCGLLETNGGEIYVDGVLFNKDNAGVIRNKIGVIFQNPDNQYIGTTLKDDIIFGLENRNINPDEMDSIIEEVSVLCGVNDLLEKEPYAMSGGQKQKGAIAGVLALSAKVLILDEATSMLDPISKKEFKENILRLQREKNLTIISITHDRDETLSADQVIVLDKGNIVFDGSNIDLYNMDLEKYNLRLPSIIEIQKALKYKEYILDESEFFKRLEGDNK
jgi:energy-coupling factor transport system ATP-binding protein